MICKLKHDATNLTQDDILAPVLHHKTWDKVEWLVPQDLSHIELQHVVHKTCAPQLSDNLHQVL